MMSTPHDRRPRGGGSAPDDPVDAVRRGLLSLLRSRGLREGVESVVIAFALAFLFRTFEAEAFVIPTGSMAVTLLGRQLEVECPKCHYHYRVGASHELNKTTEEQTADVVAGTCPQCGYTACLDPQLGRDLARNKNPVFNSGAEALSVDMSSSNGDRIVVSKFAYLFREPQRWDVFVFRFPGDASVNYIKRLVGLPGETLRIYGGKIYRRDFPTPPAKMGAAAQFEIQRKPPEKILAMMKLVNDNQYVLDDLTHKGWPTSWSAWPRNAPAQPGDWLTSDGTRTFATDGKAAGEVWLRYQHLVPSFEDWQELLRNEKLPRSYRRQIRPQLITDTCAFNSMVLVKRRDKNLRGGGRLEFPDSMFLGLNWVSDLVLECELTVEKPGGSATLELVAGGVLFHCRFDLATGKATLSMAAAGAQNVFSDERGAGPRELTAATPLSAAGKYRLRFANVDQELHLWVNDRVIHFPQRATYAALGNTVPQTNSDGGLDLAPAGVGAKSAAVRVGRLRLLRDVYYRAADNQNPLGVDYPLENLPDNLHASISNSLPKWDPRSESDEGRMDPHFERERATFLSNPNAWPMAFANLREVRFPLLKSSNPQKDQFFAMGDNSPQSSDSRLWTTADDKEIHYVERELLIGKALTIYWPLDRWRFVR